MTHTYATIDEFKATLTGNTSGLATAEDATILDTLEGASRAVDAYCDRSRFGSGFGPRTGTNSYDGDGSWCLELDDDLLSITTFTVYQQTAGTASVSPALNTDYYPQPYDVSPTRAIELHGFGPVAFFPAGRRISTILGSWGYQSTTDSMGTAGTASASAGTVVASGTTVSGGHTLLIGAEHLYVRSASNGTAVVDRGVNGTTAAIISAGTAVAVFTYPQAVKTATLAVAQRRWKQRDAGLTGDFGLQGAGFRDSEKSILRAHVHHLKIYGAG